MDETSIFYLLSSFSPSERLIQMAYDFFISFFLVPVFHFFHNVIEVYARIFPENEEVVEEVAGFVYDFFLVFVLVGDDDFGGFFSDFFVDLVFAFFLEVVGVGFFLGMDPAVFDFFKEGVEDGKVSFSFPVIPAR